jgi:hypothetical protein
MAFGLSSADLANQGIPGDLVDFTFFERNGELRRAGAAQGAAVIASIIGASVRQWPVVLLSTALLVFAGLVALRSMPVDALPDCPTCR